MKAAVNDHLMPFTYDKSNISYLKDFCQVFFKKFPDIKLNFLLKTNTFFNKKLIKNCFFCPFLHYHPKNCIILRKPPQNNRKIPKNSIKVAHNAKYPPDFLFVLRGLIPRPFFSAGLLITAYILIKPLNPTRSY